MCSDRKAPVHAGAHWRRLAQLSLVCMLGALFVAPHASAGLLFNVAFDSSASSAPVGFESAFNYAIGVYESLYTNPITINIDVGWGEIDGRTLNPGDLGQSETNQQGAYSYSQIKTALDNNANSPVANQAVSTLPGTDPTGGSSFYMSDAEAKALDLRAANDPGLDGWVGFDSSASWTFDPNNRAVGGEDDFIGVAMHEISEVMGRYGMGQNGFSSGAYSPIDLYRWSSPGVRDLTPSSTGDYFSIDGGNTVINSWNPCCNGGDLSDWAGNTADSYNAFLSTGEEEPLTTGDVELMTVLGYQPAATPEPSSIALLAGGLACLLFVGYRARLKSDQHTIRAEIS